MRWCFSDVARHVWGNIADSLPGEGADDFYHCEMPRVIRKKIGNSLRNADCFVRLKSRCL